MALYKFFSIIIIIINIIIIIIIIIIYFYGLRDTFEVDTDHKPLLPPPDRAYCSAYSPRWEYLWSSATTMDLHSTDKTSWTSTSIWASNMTARHPRTLRPMTKQSSLCGCLRIYTTYAT